MRSDELKKLRIDNRYKQTDFAELIGISNSWLSQLENSDAHVPEYVAQRAKTVLKQVAIAEAKAEVKAEAHTKSHVDSMEIEAEKKWLAMMEAERAGNEIVAGLAPDAPIIENVKGGKQSHVPYRFDLMHAKSMFKMAEVLEYGARRYDPWNWLKIDIEDHLNHLICHAYAWLAGDRSDEHLSHIMCRAMFAQGVELEGRKEHAVGQTDEQDVHPE